jgi:hypothetical protein
MCHSRVVGRPAWTGGWPGGPTAGVLLLSCYFVTLLLCYIFLLLFFAFLFPGQFIVENMFVWWADLPGLAGGLVGLLQEQDCCH